MKIELDGDIIRLGNAAVGFVRANTSAIDRTRLGEMLDRANTIQMSPKGVARQRIEELQTQVEEMQKKLSDIIDEIGEIE